MKQNCQEEQYKKANRGESEKSRRKSRSRHRSKLRRITLTDTHTQARVYTYRYIRIYSARSPPARCMSDEVFEAASRAPARTKFSASCSTSGFNNALFTPLVCVYIYLCQASEILLYAGDIASV